jgi:hypothetical protein
MTSPKVLGPEFGLVEYLNFYTQEELNEQAAKPSGFMPVRPSSAGKCGRELAYAMYEYRGKAFYEKKPLDPATSRIFSYGNDTERHLVWQFKKAKNMSLRHTQQTLAFFRLPKQDILLTGSIDGVMAAIDGSWGVLVDFKSKKDKHSSFSKTAWSEWATKLSKDPTVVSFGEESFYIDDLSAFYERNRVSEYYLMMNFLQLNFYYFSEDNFCAAHKIDVCSLIYYNKNDSRLREIRFKPSRALYDLVKEKFLAVDASEVPEDVPQGFELGSLACAFCPYSKACWGDIAKPDKEFFKTLGYKLWPKDTNRLGTVGETLELKFGAFQKCQEISEDAAAYEAEIVTEMHKNKIKKIRLVNGDIYELKHLKSGGVGGGARMVLRRSKL